MLLIALNEIIQLLRNCSVVVSGLLIPCAVSAWLVLQHEQFTDVGSPGHVASPIVFTVAAFSLYLTVVKTLAPRLQTFSRERLRSTAASDCTILLELLLPAIVLAAVQTALILTVLTAVAGGPDDVVLLVVGVVTTMMMMCALALATVGLIDRARHARMITLPIGLGVVAISTWVAVSGTKDSTTLKRALPGGSASELIGNAWNGGTPLLDSLLLLLSTVSWVLIAVGLAGNAFRAPHSRCRPPGAGRTH